MNRKPKKRSKPAAPAAAETLSELIAAAEEARAALEEHARFSRGTEGGEYESRVCRRLRAAVRRARPAGR